MRVFYTFGTDKRYPYQGGWIIIETDSIEKAHRIFQAFYPDRTPGVLNCADYYTEEAFEKTGMYEQGNYGRFCHKTIRVQEA